MTSFMALSPAVGQDHPRNLAKPGLLDAVHTLREAGDGRLLDAAQEWLDGDWPSTMDEVASRFGVSVDALDSEIHAVTEAREFLDEGDVAPFGRRDDLGDGAVVIIAASRLTRGEVADLVQGKARPDIPTLSTMLALRGFRVPAPAAMGVSAVRA